MPIDPTNKTITMPMGEYNNMQLRMEQLGATVDEYEKEVPLLIVREHGPYYMRQEHKVYTNFTAQNLTKLEPMLDEYIHKYLSEASEAKERVEEANKHLGMLNTKTDVASSRLSDLNKQNADLSNKLDKQAQELKTPLPLWFKTIAAVLYTLVVIKFMQG